MPNENTVRILSWNVHHRSRPEDIVKHLRDACADVLCLQELSFDSSHHPGVHVPDLIAAELGMHSFSRRDRRLRHDLLGDIRRVRDSFMHDGMGIFSTLPISRSKAVTLSRRGLNKYARSQGHRRSYLEADITLPGRETPLTVATTHMSFFAAVATDLSIHQTEERKLVEATRDRARNFVLTGDFNGRPQAGKVRRMAERFRMVSDPSISTYRGIMDRTLDYIFTSHDISVQDVRVLDQGPSDHCPIVVEIAVDA